MQLDFGNNQNYVTALYNLYQCTDKESLIVDREKFSEGYGS